MRVDVAIREQIGKIREMGVYVGEIGVEKCRRTRISPKRGYAGYR